MMMMMMMVTITIMMIMVVVVVTIMAMIMLLLRLFVILNFCLICCCSSPFPFAPRSSTTRCRTRFFSSSTASTSPQPSLCCSRFSPVFLPFRLPNFIKTGCFCNAAAAAPLHFPPVTALSLHLFHETQVRLHSALSFLSSRNAAAAWIPGLYHPCRLHVHAPF